MKSVPRRGNAAAHGENGSGRYTVDAAAKALELLSTFSFAERRLSLSELASRTGIPRATAFRLSTLEASASPRSASSISWREMPSSATSSPPIWISRKSRSRTVALRDATRDDAPPSRSLAGRVSRTGAVAAPGRFMRSRVGAILPAFCTALGKTPADLQEAEVGAGPRGNVSRMTQHHHVGETAAQGAARGARARLRADEEEHELGGAASPRRFATTRARWSGDQRRRPDRPHAPHTRRRHRVEGRRRRHAISLISELELSWRVSNGEGTTSGWPLDAAQPAHGGRR